MPDLSETALFWIDLALLVIYLPLGFMAWAFSAGAADNARAARKFTLAALAPAILLLLCLALPPLLPPKPAQILRWIPPGAAVSIIGLIFLAAIVTGFLKGLTGQDESQAS